MKRRRRQRGFTGIELGCVVGFAIGFLLVAYLVSESQKNKPKVLEVRNTERVVENAGTENKIIDNTGSVEPIGYDLVVENRWRTEYTIDYRDLERIAATIGIPDDAIKAEVTASLEKSEGVSLKEVRESVRHDTIRLKIPARRVLNVCITWRKVWQNGIVKVQVNSQNTADVPFRLLEGQQFDYKTARCE